jgi:NAD(P)-dependent dehydrogenase (short-subunit alcohol dehydrogenase family)
MKIDRSIAAVFTGDASGSGRVSAEAFAAAGAQVPIFDLNEEAGREVAKAIESHLCKVDILSEESVVKGCADARTRMARNPADPLRHGEPRSAKSPVARARRASTASLSTP